MESDPLSDPVERLGLISCGPSQVEDNRKRFRDCAEGEFQVIILEAAQQCLHPGKEPAVGASSR